jgi:putative DNA primase/helicase
MSWSTDNLSQDQRQQIATDHFTVQEQRGDELHGLCPAHDDHNTSFSYNAVKDACNCLACGFKGDLIALWGAATGHTDNTEAFKAFKARYSDGTVPAPTSGKRKGGLTPGAEGGAGDDSSDDATKIIPEKEWEQLPLLPENWRKRCIDKFGWSEEVIDRFGFRLRTFKDETRLAIPIRRDDGAMVNIRLYLPGGADNKIISWGAGYGKAKLFPAPSTWAGCPIIICEGEKDTITAISNGFNACTQTSGANSWDDKRFNRFFGGRKVYIAYDADEPGAKGAKKVADKLADAAGSVWIIQWPSFMEKGDDVTDWFTKHGKTAEEFTNLLLDAVQVGKKESKTGRSRAEKAERVPDEQQKYFEGGSLRPVRVANDVLTARKIANDPKIGVTYQWNGRCWEEIHESTIRHQILVLLGDVGKTQYVSDVARIVADMSGIRGDRSFNDRPGMLPLQNGIFSLQNMQVDPHNQDNLNTYCLDISFKPDPDNIPQCPVFSQFMTDFIKDPASRREVLKFMAYCFTRETKHEKALFLIGPGGDGKSTFIRIMEFLLGEINVSNVSLGALEDQFQRVLLKDKLLNVSTEIEGGLLQSGMFKAVVSGDRISASYKHRDGFSFKPVAKHIFAANKFPPIQDTSRGLLRRMIIVETARSFSTPDLGLADKLLAELDGIFIQLIHALKLLQEEGFKDEEIPYLVECKARFAENNNPVIGFINSHVEECHEAQIETLKVYERYVKFCSKRGYKPKTENNFGKELKGHLPKIERKREGGGRRLYFYHNLLLVDDEL